MKKGIIIAIIVLVIGVIGYYAKMYYEQQRIKNAIIKVELINPLEVNVFDEVSLNDLIVSINGNLINNQKIKTEKLGVQEITFYYINEENIKVPYTFSLNVVDKIPPIIWLNDTYQVDVGYQKDLSQAIMCGDNYDEHPKCFINGSYDTNKIGNYSLEYEAIDQSGNVTKKDFLLKVTKPNKKNTKTNTIPFRSLYNEYKKENTQIGIDVSKWQGDIDYQKVKEAGVEFVFIKIGGQNGIKKEYYLDPKFERNIKGFQEVGIPVGLYFYSYADSVSEAQKEALWVIEQIKDYKVSLPIAFDWENWGSFNQFQISFHTLTKMAEVFVKTLEKNGYQGMLYSSKNYLEKIWLKNDLPTWLAHYTNQTDYQGNYTCWQRTSSAKLSGITVNTVDVDICYQKR